ncbi:MAG: hypothetical protein KGK03_02895 [Candidatus Omnitrophica bacterium]|nr:hypothetical protein [Candidatus Omnitrophota bacterium]
MFPQFKKIDNESGIILFVVLMTAIIIMLFALGILTQSLNEINYAQQQIDQIATDELSRGMFWNWYSTSSTAPASPSGTMTINNRTYGWSMSYLGASTSNQVSVTANYDTFQ